MAFSSVSCILSYFVAFLASRILLYIVEDFAVHRGKRSSVFRGEFGVALGLQSDQFTLGDGPAYHSYCATDRGNFLQTGGGGKRLSTGETGPRS